MPNDGYWQAEAQHYQDESRISCDDFHYGPLIPGDSFLRLLPPELKKLRCLEIACGGAQNSIYLARQGACCSALDASAEQLRWAENLSREYQVSIDFNLLSMADLRGEFDSFDLIHSAYGLNFTRDLFTVIGSCSELLNKNGILLFSLPHPLFSGEFLELEGMPGMFLENYFRIPPDLRFDADGEESARSNFYTIAEVSAMLAENGFLLERVCEPEPGDEPPYTSVVWEEYRPQLQRFPGTIIFKAVKR